jgi:hypothetical protein
MGRIIPIGIRDPFEMLPMGTLVMEIESLEEALIGKQGQEKYGWKANMKVVDPINAAGITHDEAFFIGTDDDPNADNEDTWIKKAGRLKSFCECIGVVVEGADSDVVSSEAKGRRIVGVVSHRMQPEFNRDGSPNQYAGNPRAEVRWFAEGEKEVGLAEDQTPLPARAQKPAATLGAGPRPVGQLPPRAAAPPSRLAQATRPAAPVAQAAPVAAPAPLAQAAPAVSAPKPGPRRLAR